MPGPGRVPVSQRRAAVLGRPIAHSLSPVLHRAAYQALGLAWDYQAHEVDATGLAAFLGRVRAEHPCWAGLSLTMPLKEAAVALLDRLGTDLGAVNTVVVQPDGALVGENTDVDGVLAGLRALGLPLAGTGPVALLGAGGTARAALAALARAGVGQVVLLARDVDRGQAVARAGRELGLQVQVRPFGPPPAGAPVVSTVPAGAADHLPVTGPLLDVTYRPWPTGYAARVQAAGLAVVGGRTVLLGQAVRQVELMTGHPAPEPAMRAALEAAAGPP